MLIIDDSKMVKLRESSPHRYIDQLMAVTGSVSGVVTKNGLAINSLVRIYAKDTGLMIDEVRARRDGRYSLSNIGLRSVFVVAHDLAGKLNAVVADSVKTI